MTGQRPSHRWAWEDIGPPTWEPGPQTGELEVAYGRELNIQFSATALVDIPAVSMPIAHSLKTSVALC